MCGQCYHLEQHSSRSPSLVLGLFFVCVCFCRPSNSFPESAVTNHHKLDGVKQQTFIVLLLRRPKIQTQVVRVVSFGGSEGQSCLPPSF